MVPVVGNVPLQPPEAVQYWALAAFHCSVTDSPIATLFAFAFRVTEGGETTAGVAAPLAAGGDVGEVVGADVSAEGDVNAFEL